MRELRIRGYRRAETRPGDDLQAVAARELGDAARWPELVALNGLSPPYIVESLQDLEDGIDGQRVIIAGLTIKVPAPPPRPSAVGNAQDIFGTDLDLENGDLSATAAGDLVLVEDLPNLRQALRHRLDTPVRTLVFHPEYGSRLDELRGQGSNPLNEALAVVYGDRALRADPRIDRTEGTVATIAGDIVNVSSTAITVDGKNLPVGGE